MTTMSQTAPCPKCAGTGTVTRFLDYQGGVCFDCDGTGTTTAPLAATVTTYTEARKVGDLALTNPDSVDADTALVALTVMREQQHTWGQRDYDRQHALIARI